MAKSFLLLLGLLMAAGCAPNRNVDAQEAVSGSAPGKVTGKTAASGLSSLAAARKGFKTHLIKRGSANEPLPKPPPAVFRLVEYDSPVGKLPAYLTPDAGDGKKRPAIIWITGGDCNSIGDVWSPMPPENDQTASAYRKAGIVMMFASLRGGNKHPGPREGLLGEVNDVLAAADYLAKQPYVDPTRIYLGGHSTGGTLALLVAEYAPRFRAVFSFGPVQDVSSYGGQYIYCYPDDRREIKMRSPGYYLDAVHTPTFVMEGDGEVSNITSLLAMYEKSDNPSLHFLPVKNTDHFGILAKANRLLASKILLDTGPTCNLTVSSTELNALFQP